MKLYFKKERMPHILRTEFIDGINYTDMFVVYRDDTERFASAGFITLQIKEKIEKQFESVEFISIIDDEYEYYIKSIGFTFEDKADEAFFLVWSCDGIEI
jgi:hypothetical protein